MDYAALTKKSNILNVANEIYAKISFLYCFWGIFLPFDISDSKAMRGNVRREIGNDIRHKYTGRLEHWDIVVHGRHLSSDL